MKKIVIAIAIYLINKSESLCRTQLTQNQQNGTVCLLDEIDSVDPLKLKIEHPQYLYLTIKIGEIPKNAFDKVQPVRELWFIGDNITRIQPGAFDHLTHLESIVVTNTTIKKFEKDTFAGLTNLRTLSLNDNQIEEIEEGAFNDLENLQQLFLNNNHLKRIEEKTFQGLKFLRELYFRGNPVEYIHLNALNHLTNLTMLTAGVKNGSNIDENALLVPRIFRYRIYYYC